MVLAKHLMMDHSYYQLNIKKNIWFLNRGQTLHFRENKIFNITNV